MYESVVFFVGAGVVLYLWLRKALLDGAGRSLYLLCGAAALLALNLSAVPERPAVFMPSLRSGWLIAHVSLSFVAYAMYGAAAFMGFSLMFKPQNAFRARWVRDLVAAATLVFTVGGLLFGAVWAHHSWGRFWAWDPKETWAFITWCAYLLLLHFDLRRTLSNRMLGLWAFLNFWIVLFTYFGVSLLFVGLHGYIA